MSQADRYSRLLGQFDGLPDTLATRDSIIRVTSAFGLEGTTMYVVKTVRLQHRDENGTVTASEDTVFLEVHGQEENLRLVIPSQVTDTIARQRDALTGKSRTAAGKRVSAARKAAGLQPGFMKAARKGVGR